MLGAEPLRGTQSEFRQIYISTSSIAFNHFINIRLTLLILRKKVIRLSPNKSCPNLINQKQFLTGTETANLLENCMKIRR